MKVLEIFSGTKSISKIAVQLEWEVVSLDLKGADINCNILDWDYRQYEPGSFDIIWASPPCNCFSHFRKCLLGRFGITEESIQNDIENIALPVLYKTLEIIDYLNPKYYFIENPQTGRMKEYMDRPFYDVDYCQYSDWGYRKRTRIWTNLQSFSPKRCHKHCANKDGTKHRVRLDWPTTKLRDRYRIPPMLIQELFSLTLSHDSNLILEREDTMLVYK